MKIKPILTILLLAALFTTAANPSISEAAGNTYYIAPYGNDSSGNGSIGNPYATFAKANILASSGDTVIARAGTYNEVVTCVGGVTYQNYPGETPVVDGNGYFTGSGQGWSGLVSISQVDDVVWDGIDVYRSNEGTGIMIQLGCDNIVIKNAYIHDIGRSGVMTYSDIDLGQSWNTNIEIYNCEIEDVNNGSTQSQEAISIMGVNGVEVHYNYLHDCLVKEGIDFKDGVRNGSMHHNIADNIDDAPFYVDAYDDDCTNIEIYNNIAMNSDTAGICLSTEQGGTLSNIKVYNNLVYNCKDGLSVLDYTARPGTHTKTAVQIFNNTFVDNSRWQIWVQDPAENFINLVVANNLFAHSSAINVFKWDDWGNLAGATLEYNLFQAGIGFGSNIITGDPLFLARGNNDYSLQAASPAVDSGYTAHTPSDDINGNARPSGSGYDIGAYELTDASVPNQSTDVNNDGAVNVLDLISIGQHWEETGPSGWRDEDVNLDGVINILDIILIGQDWTG